MDYKRECKWEAKYPNVDEVLACVRAQGGDPTAVETTCKECPYLRVVPKKLQIGGRL